MMVPPLSERPVTEEDEEQFRRESAPRRYTLRERWADYRADVKRNRPKGAQGALSGVDGRRRRGLGAAWRSCSCSLADPTPSTSTVLLTAGGMPGVKSPPLRRRLPPLLGLHRPHRANLPCRAATKSDPTEFSCAQPSTQHRPIPNPNYPKKPKKTPNAEQKQQRNTILQLFPTHGIPETHNPYPACPLRGSHSRTDKSRRSMDSIPAAGRMEMNQK